MKNCYLIDEYASGCSCLWWFAHFCRTKIAHDGEHVAPELIWLYLKIFSLPSPVQRNHRQSWSCGWMQICMNIDSMSAVIATEYCLKRRRRQCSMQSGSSPLRNASLSERPLYFEEAFTTLLILSGFCLLITGWWRRYQTECLQKMPAVVM